MKLRPRHRFLVWLVPVVAIMATTAIVAIAWQPPSARTETPDADAEPAPSSTGMGSHTRITGTVSIVGPVPERRPLGHTNDPVCDRAEPVLEDVVANQDGRVADVLVRIAPGQLVGRWPAPDAVLDQHGCQYVPRTLGVVGGGSIVVRNSDRTTHNVHTYRGGESRFNQGQPPGVPDFKLPSGAARADDGIITFACDIHKWMHAYVVVTDHPFFTTTSITGTFVLEGMPAGRYMLEAWHAVFGSKVQTVDVREDDVTTALFTYDPIRDKRDR